MYKLINQLENVNNVGLLLLREGENREIMGHNRKLREGRCQNNKFTFPPKNVDTWNGLKDEVVTANCVHQMKEKLDI